uniref:Uncharacterized protein n=1 Tax=Arundo donax TaxID=35708 RepID=A0A0A9AY18_ARUDO
MTKFQNISSPSKFGHYLHLTALPPSEMTH